MCDSVVLTFVVEVGGRGIREVQDSALSSSAAYPLHLLFTTHCIYVVGRNPHASPRVSEPPVARAILARMP